MCCESIVEKVEKTRRLFSCNPAPPGDVTWSQQHLWRASAALLAHSETGSQFFVYPCGVTLAMELPVASLPDTTRHSDLQRGWAAASISTQNTARCSQLLADHSGRLSSSSCCHYGLSGRAVGLARRVPQPVSKPQVQTCASADGRGASQA